MDYSRRQTLGFGTALATVALAGCLNSSDADSDTSADDTDDSGGAGNGDDGNEGSDNGVDTLSYTWEDATRDSYWYSLYTMSTNIAMSGNGVTFPSTEQQQETFEQRLPEMVAAAEASEPPIANPNLNMAPFTDGDPQFTQEPVMGGDESRPDASTLQWDQSRSSGVVSPSSVAWTHLKGITWAKNFQTHEQILPPGLASQFRSMLLSTMAQIGTVFALVPAQSGGGKLRLNDENLLLASEFRPGEGVVDSTPAPRHHSAMLWFLSNLNSLAGNSWFGYENPEPLVSAENVQMLLNGMGQTTMNSFAPDEIPSTRLAGELLGGIGWFLTQTENDDLREAAVAYADNLAGVIVDNLDENGRVAGGGANQAATQGIVGQGLLWASEGDEVDHTDTAENILGYLLDELWDDEAGTFSSGGDDDVYTITARDAGDITGGLNAAEAVLGMDVTGQYARYFNQTLNRGHLQRAERPPSRDQDAEFTLPLPPMAGGEFGQAAVYNAEVAYDTAADEWSVTDDAFDTEASLYLSNQELWLSNWGNQFYEGRGRPGHTDTPPEE